jgi:acyl-CoA synthetase (AMP-forming)/AMP-acid ligase II
VTEAETGRTLTYGAALHGVRRLQSWLGDESRTIAVALPTSIELAQLWLAALTGGHRLVPTAPDTTATEFAALVARWQPDLAVLADESLLASAADLPASVIASSQIASLVHNGGEAADHAHRAWRPRGGELALTTSGTTGEPKRVRLSAGQIALTADAIRRSHRLSTSDRGLSVLPFYHINAPVVSLCTTLLTGATLVVAPRFSLRRFWTWIEDHQVTWASIVPTLVALLLQGEETPHIPHSLRFLRSASAPLPAAHLRAFERRFGVPLIETYGLSEAASTVTANPVPPDIHKAGSVGLPMEGIELRVCRLARSGEEQMLRDVGQHEEGEVCVRGQSVIAGYDGRPDDPSFVDGWFRTGDLGHQDADGYLYLTGRLREVINHGGHKIAPREIEEVLLTHPSVAEVAVVGQPDPLYGERVVAYVVPDQQARPQADLGELLRTQCLNRLSAYKVPSEFALVARLPRTSTGKVRRHLLSAEYAGDHAVVRCEHASASR